VEGGGELGLPIPQTDPITYIKKGTGLSELPALLSVRDLCHVVPAAAEYLCTHYVPVHCTD
jgi:hypothetical protein